MKIYTLQTGSTLVSSAVPVEARIVGPMPIRACFNEERSEFVYLLKPFWWKTKAIGY
jgi:hypothetical protein